MGWFLFYSHFQEKVFIVMKFWNLLFQVKKSHFASNFMHQFVLQHTAQESNALPGNTNWRGRLSTVDLLIKVACFVKRVNNNLILKGEYINLLVQGGQLYLAFPFSKISLVLSIVTFLIHKNLAHWLTNRRRIMRMWVRLLLGPKFKTFFLVAYKFAKIS
jgi:hypothetical protein